MENGPIVLRCYAVLWAQGPDGFGIVKTMYGQKFIRSVRTDGFTATRAKTLGTSLSCMSKDGANEWPIVLAFLWKGPLM